MNSGSYLHTGKPFQQLSSLHSRLFDECRKKCFVVLNYLFDSEVDLFDSGLKNPFVSQMATMLHLPFPPLLLIHYLLLHYQDYIEEELRKFDDVGSQTSCNYELRNL
ncbi:hypothetical protein CDAR_209561 [Caerostris darwini]|uniref:Maturase K n=1 Tax=Caerostris darwini TaxID=1538125 RepID=A0AAV4V7R5_9ARAC|nr:hypothetical protein CDAR_209561 [Caerostris darwini]